MARFLLSTFLIALALLYAAAASHFYEQERWARTPVAAGAVAAERMRHPDAVLGTVREAIEAGNLSDPIESYIGRALGEAPASYQSSFLLAAFLANRLEDPERTELAFETALRFFPANGRLHLSYAQWLLTSQAGAPRWTVEQRTVEEGRVLRERALRHLETATRLQEDLVPDTLRWLVWSRVPSSEWEAFVPDTASARVQLARALKDAGDRPKALEVLTAVIRSTSDERFLEDTARWAFAWKAPAVAREAGERWLALEREMDRSGARFAGAALVVARAHLELGDPNNAYHVYSEAMAAIEREAPKSSMVRLDLLVGMANAYLNTNQPIMAESLLLEATKSAPGDASIWLALARAYRKAGKADLSIRSYREVLRIQPGNRQAEQELQPLLGIARADGR